VLRRGGGVTITLSRRHTARRNLRNSISRLRVRRTKLVQVVDDPLGSGVLEDWLCTRRTGYRLAPSFEHLLELTTNIVVNLRVGMHERLIEITAEVDGVWAANILDYRIQNVQGWQFPSWRCLRGMSRRTTRQYSELTLEMWFCKTLDMASACSIFSFAISVRLEI
jgi:hypothetical protein